MSKVHFFPPSSSSEFSFWEKLYDMKLNKYGLSGSTQDERIRSFYSQQEIKLTSLSFDDPTSRENTENGNEKKSDEEDFTETHQRFYSDGYLRNVNTINVYCTSPLTPAPHHLILLFA
jgi:hypothetical protein